MKKNHKGKRSNPHRIKRRIGNAIGNILRGHSLQKHEEEDEEDDVSSYCVILRKRKSTGN
jgi:hypothetical protein